MGRVEDVKTKLSCEASYKSYKFQKVEDVKTRLSCKPSFKFQQSKIYLRREARKPAEGSGRKGARGEEEEGARGER